MLQSRHSGGSLNSLKYNNYKLKGSLKKCGFDSWRYVFNGVNSISGEERNFFIELFIINPVANSEVPSSKAKREVPGYCCLRTGILGKNPRQFIRHIPFDELSIGKKKLDIKIGGCEFLDTSLSGMQVVTKEYVKETDFIGNSVGKMEWNLKYKYLFNSRPVVGKDGSNWYAAGINTEFSGTVNFDGVEYIVSPDNSFGYSDKSWGTTMHFPFVHVNSARMMSIFTGKIMQDSGFVFEGEFDGKTTLIANFNGEEYSFGKGKKISKYESRWNCVKTPSNDDEELHWSISLSCKKYVLDIDVFSNADEMVVKEYDIPSDGSVLKVLCSGSAMGEIRLYKRLKKSLELIQQTKILNAVVEYGAKDSE